MSMVEKQRENKPWLRKSDLTLGGLTSSFIGERTSKLGAGESALREVVKLFSPDYMKGEEQATLAGVQADMASRGLANTTIPSALSVGVKRQYGDLRKTRIADALSALAQFLGQTAPAAPTIAGLASTANQALRQGPISIPRMNTSQGIDFRYAPGAQPF